MDIQKNISIEIMSKKSIRFFNDREVRAVWDDANNKWWFSATDIVRAINDEEDYKKCRNYWKYLKGKMTKDGIQLVSVTNHFKFQAPDGKQRAADALRKSGTVLVTHFESEIDRLVYHLYEVKQVPVPAFYDTVFEALRQLGSVTSAVYVGDSDVDLATARNSGLPCISVLWGFRTKQFLLEHGATTFIEHPNELLSV